MTFKDLLDAHEGNIEHARRMMQPDILAMTMKTEEYWRGYIYSSFQMFQTLRNYCDDGYPKIRTDLTEEEKVEFDTEKDFPLYGIMEYRGIKVPVYDDDYGQQMFAIYDGSTISGGSYNFFPEHEFVYFIDSKLDLKYNN